MAMGITVETKGVKEVQNYMSRLETTLPKALEGDSRKIMNDFKTGLRDSAKSKDLVWHGILTGEAGI